MLRLAVAVALLAAICAIPAHAQSGTWTGLAAPNANWNQSGNWSPASVPTATANFGTLPVVPPVPSVIVDATTFIETIRFDGTTAYTIAVTLGCGCGGDLFVTGTGVVNNSGVLQTFDVSSAGLLVFQNASSIVGNVRINVADGALLFGTPGTFETASAGSATIVNTVGLGPLYGTFFVANSNAGTAKITNDSGGMTFFLEQSSAANSEITNTDGGQTIFGFPSSNDIATAGNARIIADGLIQNLFFPASVVFNAFTTAGNATIDVRNGAFVEFYDNSTGGNARFITDMILGSTVDFSQTFGPLGDGVVSAGSIEGGGTFIIGVNNLVVGGNNRSTNIFGAVEVDNTCVCGAGTLTKVGTGTLTFDSGINLTNFRGYLVVDGGTVVMNDNLSNAISATVNPGGTLAGGSIFLPGILPTTIVNGGTFSPGNGTTGDIGRLSVFGSLQFAPGSTYAVDVAPTGAPGIPLFTSADFALISGPAALAGTLRATGIGGSGYTVGAMYPVLGTFTGLNGSRFDNLYVAGSFGSTRPVIVYGLPTDTVYIELIQGEVSSQLTPAATQNQIALARGLDNALRNGADFGSFTQLYNLSGDFFLKALDQLSGEANTGIFTSAFKSLSDFFGSMLNPFTNNRGGFGPASPYAAEDDESGADSYAAKRRISKKAQQAMAAATPVKAAPPRDNRYATWANGYGGQTSIDGNGVVGSHQTNVRGYGFAAGLDFRATPDALLGFALAGGNSSWSLAQGLGGGNTDNFHIGGYGSLRFGPAYLSAALAYGTHWANVKRSVVSPGFASLQSDYDAHSLGGRIEAGYRYGWNSLGITPYAALQGSTVRLPGYQEKTLAGDNSFAIQYGAQSDHLVRTELGSWIDHSRVIPGGVMTLRARAAWAHDEGADRSLTGGFPVLPGSTFLVQGANPGNDFALLSAGAEWRYWNGFSFAARFDSELSDRSRGFGGTGVFRYVW